MRAGPAQDGRRGPNGATLRASGALSVYALAHGAVDATCVGALWAAYHGGSLSSRAAWSAFFLYNLLAFAVQPLIGLSVDRFGRALTLAAAGALATAAGLGMAALPHAAFLGVAVLGLGNAAFHVGGGVMSLKAAPGRATPLGVFVAPGAAGVVAGTLVGRAGGPVWLFAVALLPLAAATLVLPAPVFAANPSSSRSGSDVSAAAATGLELIVLLLLFVIAVRAYAGMALVLPWKSHLPLLAFLTTGVVLGKGLGGVLADRFGWRAVAVSALLLSIPLLALGPTSAAAGVAGSFLFNMTMPITLVAVAHALHGHDGFAFGLTCLALFVGSAPVIIGGPGMSAPTLVVLALVAAGALWIGLGRLLPRPIARRPKLNAGTAVEEVLE
jgi:FSR family fosmidomycin resistance protein-like MFS transporter